MSMSRSSSAAIAQKKMARSAGLEPAASGVEFRCPIQLGHERNAGQAISHISVIMRGLLCAPSRWPIGNDFGLGQAEAERVNASCTGLKDRRWIGVGPSRDKAFLCSGVP